MTLLRNILGLGALAGSYALSPATVQRQEFVVGSERLVLVGVDYQPGGQGAYGEDNTSDPLSNGTLCLRDAALLQGLGVNVIRSYNVDPTLNHDDCAAIFEAAGIYMILDVNSPLAGQSIDRSNPASSYNIGYLTHIFSVVENFKNYNNVLGFFAGNEVINDVPTGNANPPYIRAVQRDLKNYISARASRAIPVGYSAADVRPILFDTFEYFSCDNSDSSSSDFFGLNSYSWCGSGSSFQTSTYDQLVTYFNASTIPVFFSEYGCNNPAPRVFDEVPVIYGPLMAGRGYQGGLVYEFSQESSNFGLVEVYSNGSVQLLQDFITLSNQYNTINLTLITTTNSTATSLTPPKCAGGLIDNSGFSKNFNIPAAPDGAAALISSGVTGITAGKSVSVTATSVAVPVYNVGGSQITGLAIKTTNGPNRPGNANFVAGTTSTSTGSAAASAATTSTKTGGAYQAVATNGAVLGAAVAFAALAL